MKIVVYSSKSSYTSKKVGGAETSLRLLAEQLAEHGQEVWYITNSPARIWKCRHQTIKGVHVLFLPTFRNLFGGAVPLWLTRRFDQCISRMAAVHKWVDLHTVDVVHMFYQPVPLHWFLQQRQRFGYRVVLRMAGLSWYDDIASRPRMQNQYRKLFTSVDSIMFNSAGLKQLCAEQAERLGIDLSTIDSSVCDIGVHMRTAQLQWQGSGTGEKLHAVTATRFSGYQKRQDILIEAVKILRESGRAQPSNFSLLLVGDGSKRLCIEQLITDYGLQDLCTVQSFLPQHELWRVLQSADLLCHPTEYEGLSKIVAESMMLGLPVLASNVVPLSDDIRQAQNGFLTANDPVCWAEELYNLMKHPDKREAVSLAARQFARQQYDPGINVQKYIQEFTRFARAADA